MFRPAGIAALLLHLGMALMWAVVCAPAGAQTFPPYSDTGVVDAANLLDAAQEDALSRKLIAQKSASGRVIFVATIPDLQGYEIDQYGYQLGRSWGLGDKGENNAVLLIVAPNERKVRIEVGYGLEGILTDALSSRIIRDAITPRFQQGDMPGGINAGIDEITALLALPADEARARAEAARQQGARDEDGGGAIAALWISLFVIFFVLLPLFSSMRGGRRYRGRGGGPVVIWGPGLGGSDWGSRGGSGWGGGGFSGGGFSGGGSFGGGGASGGW